MDPSLPLYASQQWSQDFKSQVAFAGRHILMVDPDSFDIVSAINPHMQREDGSLQKVDKALARKQWETLCQTYQNLGFHVTILDSHLAYPDMVFCANQTLPFIDSMGRAAFILSNMFDDTRHHEVAQLRGQLEAMGFSCYPLPARNLQTCFEGTGDALRVPGRNLICGGFGNRTHRDMYQVIQHMTGAEVVLFELAHPKFYHLDTCLSILNSSSVLACRAGFTAEGWNLLQQMFPRILEVPLVEADSPGFACNAHCPDQKHVLIQEGNRKTVELLLQHDFKPVELDTSEFIKSGGSVFCLKLQCL